MRSTRNLLILLLASLSLCMFTGCELWELIKKAFAQNYPQEQEISVLIIPPHPIVPPGSGLEKQAEQKALNEAHSMEGALGDACQRYNRNSPRTKLIPIVLTTQEGINSFYQKDLKDAQKRALANNQKLRLSDFARDQFRKARSAMANKGDRSLSCISFGMYDFDPNATAEKFTLFYYDSSVDNIAVETGVIPKFPQRDREEEVEELLYRLLKKVYD